MKCHFIPEFALKNVWGVFKENQTVKEYMPDIKENELQERKFFFSILSTIYPDEIKAMIKDARKPRAVTQTQTKQEKIKLTKEIMEEILKIQNQPSTTIKA